MTKTQDLIDKAVAELKWTKLGYTQLKPPPTGHWAKALKLLGQARDEAGPPTHGKILLGPVIAGHPSLLQQDLTHATDGLSGYPAYDDLAKAGTAVIAPEDLTVTRWGSAQGGEAMYCRGASGLLYWFGHVDYRKPVDAKVKKGAKVASVSKHHAEPHVHVGIDGRAVIGHEFEHHVNYTHGSPTVGVQLAKAGY